MFKIHYKNPHTSAEYSNSFRTHLCMIFSNRDQAVNSTHQYVSHTHQHSPHTHTQSRKSAYVYGRSVAACMYVDTYLDRKAHGECAHKYSTPPRLRTCTQRNMFFSLHHRCQPLYAGSPFYAHQTSATMTTTTTSKDDDSDIQSSRKSSASFACMCLWTYAHTLAAFPIGTATLLLRTLYVLHRRKRAVAHTFAAFVCEWRWGDGDSKCVYINLKYMKATVDIGARLLAVFGQTASRRSLSCCVRVAL